MAPDVSTWALPWPLSVLYSSSSPLLSSSFCTNIPSFTYPNSAFPYSQLPFLSYILSIKRKSRHLSSPVVCSSVVTNTKGPSSSSSYLSFDHLTSVMVEATTSDDLLNGKQAVLHIFAEIMKCVSNQSQVP